MEVLLYCVIFSWQYNIIIQIDYKAKFETRNLTLKLCFHGIGLFAINLNLVLRLQSRGRCSSHCSWGFLCCSSSVVVIPCCLRACENVKCCGEGGAAVTAGWCSRLKSVASVDSSLLTLLGTTFRGDRLGARALLYYTVTTV